MLRMTYFEAENLTPKNPLAETFCMSESELTSNIHNFSTVVIGLSAASFTERSPDKLVIRIT